MISFDSFCDTIEWLPLTPVTLFATSKKENSSNVGVCESVTEIINRHVHADDAITCIDFFCGHGFTIGHVSKTLNTKSIGVDIIQFDEWADYSNTKFYQKDVFDVLKLTPEFRFDVVITFNTLRGTVDQWGKEKHDCFLAWCSKHSRYLVTNNCTNRKFDGFQLIDTIQVPNFYDTNIFKSCYDGKDNICDTIAE
jgi:hypothetical protein